MLVFSFVGFSQIDSVGLLNSYIDSMNSVRVVNMVPNEKYLKTLNNVYIPSVEEYEKDPKEMYLFVDFLESRYKCMISFMYEDSTNGVRDIVFAVSQNKEVCYSVLTLNLSVIEQLFQENELINQVDEYSKWSELVINF